MADERRHDLEYLAAGAVTAALWKAGIDVDDIAVPTGDDGVITGSIHVRFMGRWFAITPTLLAPEADDG